MTLSDDVTRNRISSKFFGFSKKKFLEVGCISKGTTAEALPALAKLRSLSRSSSLSEDEDDDEEEEDLTGDVSFSFLVVSSFIHAAVTIFTIQPIMNMSTTHTL